MKKHLYGLYEQYPRRYGKSSKILYSKEEFIKYVNRDNGFIDVFISVYAYANLKQVKTDYKIDSKSAIIDKLFIDIDIKDYIDYDELYEKHPHLNLYPIKEAEKLFKEYETPRIAQARLDFWEDVRKLENILRNRNILRIWVFSGGGSHTYIYIENDVINKKEFCRNALNNISNMIYGKENEIKYVNKDGKKIVRKLYDPKCPLKLSQLARVIGTYNPRRKQYCISLVEDDFNLELNDIFEKSKKPNNKIHYLGNKLMFFPKILDTPLFSNGCSVILETLKDLEKISDNLEELLKSLGILWCDVPNCMKYFLRLNQRLNYTERYLLITFLYRCGLSKNEIIEVLRLVLTADRFYHCCGKIKDNYKPSGRERGRVETQIKDIIDNDYYISCSQVKDFGYCHKDCNFGSVLEFF